MQVLEFAAVCAGCRSVGDLQVDVLPRACALTHADLAVYLQTYPEGGEEVSVTWPVEAMRPTEMEGYAEVMGSHPLGFLFQRPTSLLSARMSDAISRRDWKRHPLYLGSHRGLGVDDQMVTLAGMRTGRFHLISLSRLGRSFSDLERDLLALLQPSLRTAVRQSLSSGKPYEAVRVAPTTTLVTLSGDAIPLTPRPLTARESLIVSLLSDGQTSAAISRQLGIGQRTVEKHLENAFSKLHVTNRGDAVRRLEDIQTRGTRG